MSNDNVIDLDLYRKPRLVSLPFESHLDESFPKGFGRLFSREHAQLITDSGALDALGRYMDFSKLVVVHSPNAEVDGAGAMVLRIIGLRRDAEDQLAQPVEGFLFFNSANARDALRLGLNHEQVSAFGLAALSMAIKTDSFTDIHMPSNELLNQYGYDVAQTLPLELAPAASA